MKKILMLSVVFILVCASGAFAQTQNGNIIGKISEKSGEGLPGVSLSISGPSLIQRAMTALSNEKGTFRFFSIPPGTYVLTAELTGFQKVQRTGIRVLVGETVTADIVMSEGAIEQLITVTAPPPSIDVKRSEVSTVLSSEILRSLPLRSYDLGMLNLAPGVADSGAQGSGSTSGQYQVDGMNATGQWYGEMESDLPPDIIEESEIITAGGSAEAGEYTGALVNVITKSGSNKFTGELNAYFFNDKLVNYRKDEVNPPATHLDVSGLLGGPIIQNRLWFLMSLSYRRNKSQNPNFLDYEATVQTRPNFYTKVNYLINKANKGFLSYQYNHAKNRYGVDEWTPVGSQATSYSDESLLNLQHQTIFTQNTFLDLKMSYRYVYGDTVPDNETESMIYDIGTGAYGGGYGVNAWDKTWRVRGGADLTHFKDNWLLGSHEFKMGFMIDQSQGNTSYSWVNNTSLYNYFGLPYMKYVMSGADKGPRDLREAQAYVQDMWEPFDRLNISLGLRWSNTKARIPDLTVDGVTFAGNPEVYNWNNISPRIGFSYALTKDTKTIFRASYGRFYDFSCFYFFSGFLPYSPVYSLYNYVDGGWVLVNTFGGAVNQRIDSNLKRPYADIVTVSLQREILPKVTVEVNYVHKYFGDQIAQVNTIGEYEETTAIDPVTGKSVTVYNQTNPGDNYYVKTNPSKNNYKYDGVQLVFNKRPSDNWFLQASLHLQKCKGLADNNPYGAKQASLSGPFTDPNNMINAYGDTMSNRAYQVKALAGYSFRRLGIDISAIYSYMQGVRYSRQFYASLDQGNVSIYGVARNSLLGHSIQQLDMRLEKKLKVGPGTIGFLVDVHNIFNSNTATSLSELVDTQTEPFIYGVQDPRYFQLGVRYIF
jgi:hypothetical protein